VYILLALFQRLQGNFVLCEASPDRSCLLMPEVKGKEVLALVEFPQVLTGLLVCDREDTGDRLSDGVDFREFSSGSTSDLLHTKSQQLSFQLRQLLRQVILGLGL